MVEDEELSIEQIEAMENALNKVSVSIENETEEVSETEEKA